MLPSFSPPPNTHTTFLQIADVYMQTNFLPGRNTCSFSSQSLFCVVVPPFPRLARNFCPWEGQRRGNDNSNYNSNSTRNNKLPRSSLSRNPPARNLCNSSWVFLWWELVSENSGKRDARVCMQGNTNSFARPHDIFAHKCPQGM